jgi:serine/threonine protein kinase
MKSLPSAVPALLQHLPPSSSQSFHISPFLIPQVTETLQSHGLELRDQIGSGGFGTVYTVWHAGYQQMLVVKISAVSDAAWFSEMESLKSVYHPNIVKLYDTFQDDSFGYMVLEYCTGGNLANKIKATGPLPFREFRDVAYQLLDALSCCHAARIAHMDIKPANVFYSDDGQVRLGDFGCSGHKTGHFFGGSRPFMSPEIVCQMGSFNQFLSDIWSLGVTFYYMAAGRLPWRNTSSDAVKTEIRIGAYVPLTSVDPRIPPLIKGMLRLEAPQRASLASLIETVAEWRNQAMLARKRARAVTDASSGPGWRLSRRTVTKSFPDHCLLEDESTDQEI